MPPDYSEQNLRGRSFNGLDLEGADFSNADIRGADFTKANLRGANFTGSKAGLQQHWAMCLLGIALLLSVISGVICAFAGSYLGFLVVNVNPVNKATGVALIVGYVVFFIVTVSRSLSEAFLTLATLLILALTGGVFVAGYGTGEGSGMFAFSMIGVVTGVIVGAIAFGSAVNLFGLGAKVLALAFTIFGAFTFSTFGQGAVSQWRLAAVAVAVGFAGLSYYISWRVLRNDEKDVWVRAIVIAFTAIGGTSFRNANLTIANFTGATLKSTDFRKANLTRTCFHKTKKLDRVRPGSSYLQNTEVRQVLITGLGQDKKFDYQDLRGINLEGANLANTSFLGANLKRATLIGANLTDANFMIANLNEVNLQDTNLSRANLVQTQLFQTDFTGATLTGAYIQDWGITSDTKFNRVRCEYVYMRLPTLESPDPLRKPDNNIEVFAPGEFGDFIKPIFDTLDLYHNQGVDPRAIAISFKQLAENHPNAELEIVAMEKRGQDKFLLRAKTALDADKSQLSAEYFDTYNQIKALAEQELKALMSEKDRQIRRLENMVMTALERPSFYSNVEKVGFMSDNKGGISQNVSSGTIHGGMQAALGNNNTQTQNQGDTTVSGNRNINTGGGNYNERIQGNYVQGNYYAAGQQSLADAAAEIQKLLEQLDKSYSTDTTAGKMAIATQAIEYIDNDYTLAQRVLSALKAGGTQALAQLLNHPAASFVIGALDDWQKAHQKTEDN